MAAVRALVALRDVREDRERRARGVSVEDWLAAPAPPDTREECEDADAELELVDRATGKVTTIPARPCPALRCKHHLGRYGEAAGFTCELDFAELAADPSAATDEGHGGMYAVQTFVSIARVLNVSKRRVRMDCDLAMSRYEDRVLELARGNPELLKMLRVPRRRP